MYFLFTYPNITPHFPTSIKIHKSCSLQILSFASQPTIFCKSPRQVNLRPNAIGKMFDRQFLLQDYVVNYRNGNKKVLYSFTHPCYLSHDLLLLFSCEVLLLLLHPFRYLSMA